jgi:hypothetical protein
MAASKGRSTFFLRNELRIAARLWVFLRNELILRNELGGRACHGPYARAALFQLRQCIQRFIEGSLVSGLIAQEESELVCIDASFGESFVLEANGALPQPPGLGHLLDEERFGLVRRRVLGGEI